ncbi:MAG TPA: hypothetical protein ENJ56_03755 [Anaerolineae bacterium]|nr:hypothetical protein [Anaerolineae bacterium]
MANVARHAEASEVKVVVKESAENIHLTIHDNGKGFDINRLKSHTGHGLSNMQARANNLHGHFKIESIPQQGTTLYLSFPKIISPTASTLS